MKKLVNLIALVVLVSMNVFTPFSYAEVESLEVIPENEIKNVVETVETPEYIEEFPENTQDDLGEIEQGNLEDNAPEDVDVQDDFLLQKEDEAVIIQAQSGTMATLLPGQEFNIAIKSLANGTSTVNNNYYFNDTKITKIERVNTIPDGIITTGISTPGSGEEIIAWYNNGVLYYYTQAERIYMNTNSNYMFNNLKGITNLNLSHFDTSNVTDMSYIFQGNDNLEELNLSGWDFSKYTRSFRENMGLTSQLKKLNITNTKFSGSMNKVFYYMNNLENLILDGIDTSNVTDMSQMFYYCSNLEKLNLSSFDTSNVTNMEYMFSACNSITGLDLSNFDTSNVTDMKGMFNGCNNLEELNLSGWDFRKWSLPLYYIQGRSQGSHGGAPLKKLNLTNAKFSTLSSAFEYSYTLEEIILDGVDTSNITSLERTFYNCPKLSGLNLSSFDTSNVGDMSYAFAYCSGLTQLNLSNRNTNKVSSMRNMFAGDKSLIELNLSGWDFRKIGNSFASIALPTSIEKLNIKNGKFSGNMAEAFSGLSNLKELRLDNVDMADVTNMNSMFNGCNSLESLDVSNWDTSNVTGVNGIFAGCSNLETLKMDGWDFRKIGSPSGMLGSTTSLKSISMSGWKIPVNFTHGLSRSWGGGNSPIEEIDVTNWDLSQTRDIQGLFADSRSLRTIKGLDTRDTSNVTNMDQIFFDCEKLVELNIKGWDTSNVTDMSSMFAYCDNLEKIWGIEDINTHNVIDMNQLFYVCTSLIELDLSNWDTSNVTIMDYMFYGGYNIKNLNLSGRDFRKHMNGLSFINFYSLPNLEELNLANARFSGQVNRIFQGLSKLKKLNLEGSDVSNVTSMNGMFAGCSSLTELDLSSWDTSNVKQIYQIFAGMPKLRTIYASDSFIAPDDASSGMFGGTTSVVGGNGTKFDSGYTDKTYALIDKVGQTGYFTDKNAITVKFINTLDGTETLATFAKGQKLTPPYVDKYHVVGGYLDEEMKQAIDLNKGVDSYSVIYVKYERNGSSGGGGGGGGGGGSTKPDTPKEEQKPVESPQSDVSTGAKAKDPESNTGNKAEIHIGSQQPLSPMDSSPDSEQTVTPLIGGDGEARGGGTQSYSPEFQQAYKFAHENGITTKNTIQSAQMNGKLTRIAMAKMLSQYAINVLGKEPDVSKGVVKFNDVTSKKDADYDNGVTLAYQLGIMGQNMPGNKFRPNDEVTRAEFATALSRMAYGTSDGEYEATSKYYIHHMEKLVKEGIITKDDPNMKELRGYVMIMLMRSADG